MKYLVDANVLCETTKPAPAESVLVWIARHEHDLVVDPIILGEIRFGIHVLDAGKRRRQLEEWFQTGVQKFHCVPWEAATGLRWAKLLAQLKMKGRAMPIKDSMIAATALLHGLTMATRNLKDFSSAGVSAVNPFE